MKETLYFNGDIITLENDLYAEAILVRDGKIFKIDKKENLLKIANSTVEIIDLQGKTLIPSFIDAHSHFFAYSQTLLQPSLENATNFEEIIDIIQKFIKNNNIPKGIWVTAANYDHNNLNEKTSPTKEVLDKAAPDNPLVIKHQSGHSGVLNSIGLNELGITSDTLNPEGGIIYKKDNDPTGYLEENAFINYIQKIPLPSFNEIIKSVKKAQERYKSFGITTMQEGMVVPLMSDILNYIKNSKMLELDYIGYIDVKESKSLLNNFDGCIKNYVNRFKIGGYKIFLDGSPQSRTAYMLKPYKDATDGYRGYPIYKDEDLEKYIELAIKNNMQLLAHCNGDAASYQYISQFNIAKEKCNLNNDIRPVIVHAQLLPYSQLDAVHRLKMIPSFFVAHVYHWGDIHIKNFGFERASKISLANSASKKDLKFTFHQDSPVIEPNMLETIWCAVNRITKDGVLLGNDEKITPLEALKAVTINAAYQYFEEHHKGSIKEGKLADLVILEKNPLKVKPMEIRNIHVLETIKEGISIFKL
ncbi:MAG: amidohydrolase [Paraclostridium sp.]|uniref:amidohydrolase n=1 Tax=Paraclostridium sp. TaxID=2023273 RepID=UPI003F3707C1